MEEFIDSKNVIAVVGATNNKDKWGYRVFKKLLDEGFMVVPVNPKYKEIEDVKCFSELAWVEPKPDVVVTIVPPKVTEKVVDECVALGIGMIWMQTGSESDEAVMRAEGKGIRVIAGVCIVVDGLKKGWN